MKVAAAQDLSSGHTRSCGCLWREEVERRRGARSKAWRHGQAGNPQAGTRATGAYASWGAMLERCTNPRVKDWARYCGRGINVCPRWRESFDAFFADMGPRPSPRHSLDRYPNKDGDYEPGNVRWATHTEQMRNRRDNKIATIGGETKTLAEWSDISGIHKDTLSWRLRHGWLPDHILRAARPLAPRGSGRRQRPA